MWIHQGYLSGDLKRVVDTAINRRAEVRLVPVSAAAAGAVLFLLWWASARRPVYLVDFAVWQAPEHLKLTKERFEQGSRDCGVRCAVTASGKALPEPAVVHTAASRSPHWSSCHFIMIQAFIGGLIRLLYDVMQRASLSPSGPARHLCAPSITLIAPSPGKKLLLPPHLACAAARSSSARTASTFRTA